MINPRIEELESYLFPDGELTDQYGYRFVEVSRKNFKYLIEKVQELTQAVNELNEKLEELSNGRTE